MWWYCQRDGSLQLNTLRQCTAYSGHGEGLNNPELESVPDVGPIPCGQWQVTGVIHQDPELGPYVLVLEPLPGTDTFGRTVFRVHGDNRLLNYTASKGCVVAGLPSRERIWESNDHVITVVAEPEEMPSVTMRGVP